MVPYLRYAEVSIQVPEEFMFARPQISTPALDVQSTSFTFDVPILSSVK